MREIKLFCLYCIFREKLSSCYCKGVHEIKIDRRNNQFSSHISARKRKTKCPRSTQSLIWCSTDSYTDHEPPMSRPAIAAARGKSFPGRVMFAIKNRIKKNVHRFVSGYCDKWFSDGSS